MKRWISLFLILSLVGLLWGCDFRRSDPDSSFYWLPEESGFVDYEIADDIVRFRYRICFVNETQQDLGIKLSAAFSPKELAGWVEHKDYFNGLNDQGEWIYQTVSASGQSQLVYTFEGKYLGGEVNTSLSFPEDLMVVLGENAVQNERRSNQDTEGTVRLSNGETFTYFQHESPSNFELHGVLAEIATLEQITGCIEPYDASSDTNREMRTAEDAAYYGATALDRHFKNWTTVNEVGAVRNEAADLWIVHGMFKDKIDPGRACAVVLDASTGQVLGFTEISP